MIRARFVTGHRDCDLRRHLDRVPLGTPIRDNVDRCRVWESHTDANDRSFVKPALEGTRSVYNVSEPVVMPADRVVAVVATPSLALADLEMLSSVPAPAPLPRPVPVDIETVLECLMLSTPAPVPASPLRSTPTDIETSTGPAVEPGLRL